ncbi:hypothetical protein CA603_52395 [Paraburkholderia hospita]|nr:hypothetical protein CA603_52395 [Paraburkholderia hospita]
MSPPGQLQPFACDLSPKFGGRLDSHSGPLAVNHARPVIGPWRKAARQRSLALSMRGVRMLA